MHSPYWCLLLLHLCLVLIIAISPDWLVGRLGSLPVTIAYSGKPHLHHRAPLYIPKQTLELTHEISKQSHLLSDNSHLYFVPNQE